MPVNLKLVMGVSAILFPVLTIQTLLGIMPHPTMPETMTGDEANAFFQEWYGVQQAQTLFHILGIIWFGVFVLALFLHLQRLEPAPAFWSKLTLWSGMTAVAVKVAIMAMVSGAIALVTAPGVAIDGMIILGIYNAGWYAHVLVVYFLPFFFGAVGLAILKFRALPAWIGWFAVVCGAASVIGAVSVVHPDLGWMPYPVFMLLMVWTLATGIYCLATARIRMATTTDATPA